MYLFLGKNFSKHNATGRLILYLFHGLQTGNILILLFQLKIKNWVI